MELDNRRPEVREAFRRMDRDAPRGYSVGEEWQTLRADMLRLAGDANASRLSAETWEAKYWAMRERAEKAEAELAALKARIAKSHEVTVCRHPAGAVTMFVPEGMNGKRVRLVVDEPCDRGEG